MVEEGLISRREALARSAAALAAFLPLGCGFPSNSEGQGRQEPRLASRPGTPTETGPTGQRPLGLGTGRDGIIHVPASYTPEVAAPFALLLHGAGQNATTLMSPYSVEAESRGLILLAVDSRNATWDAIQGRFGADVQFIDRALALVFRQYRIDPAHTGICGFSDGATYTLGLGLCNGDLFRRVVAHSPGFLLSIVAYGSPTILETHGTEDQILPIDSTSRRIVPTLRSYGYTVDYREFPGGHTVPPDLRKAAADYLAGA